MAYLGSVEGALPRTITGIQLDVLAQVPQAQQGDFIRAAVCAKTNCTISRLLNANISMSAKLDNSETRRKEEVRRPIDSLKALSTNTLFLGFQSRKA